MGNNRGRKILVIASIIFILSLIRLFDSIIKRELRSEWRDLRQEILTLHAKSESLSLLVREKEGEKMMLLLQKELAEQKEPYLRIHRATKTAYLKLEDKDLREMPFSIKGRKALAGEVTLPCGILQVSEKRETTSFYLPDWIYELQGKRPPSAFGERRQAAFGERRQADTLRGIVKDAFGKYIIYLGADIVLSGKVKEEVPEEALDLIHLEFEAEDIEAIYNSLKETSSVLFF